MAPDVLLLILALTSCLTEHVYCEIKDGSGDVETEASVTDEPILATGHTPTVTTLPDVTTSDITVYYQGEQDENVEAQQQITLEHAATLMQTKNTTHTKPQNTTTGVKVNTVPEISGNATKNGTKVLRVNVGLSGNTTTNGTRVTPMPSNEEAGGKGEVKNEPTDEEDNWSIIIIIAVCVIVGLLLMAAVAAGVLIKRRRRKKNAAGTMEEDPYLDGADGEKVPMPMFEEDVPSVLELEMEDFEKWMIKDGGVSTDPKQKHL